MGKASERAGMNTAGQLAINATDKIQHRGMSN